MVRLFPTSFRERDPPFLWKIILRGLSILLAIASIGTLAWAITHGVRGSSTGESNTDDYTDDYGEDYYYGGDGMDWCLPWGFISLGLSVIWNFTNLLTIWVRDGRGIHPGANVGCDLFLWLALLVTGIFATFGATSELFWYGDGSYYSGEDNEDPPQAFYDFLHRKGVVIAVAAGIQYILLLFHFALFISACRYTHARRHPGSRYDARAITEEATIIAKKMIADMTGPGGGFIFVNGKGEHLVAHPAEQQHLLESQDRPIQPAMEESVERRNDQQEYPPSSILGKGKEPAYNPPTAFESIDSSSTGPTRSAPS